MLETFDKNIKEQYELLNILDGKSSGLLTFNAIFLASISVWLGYVPLNYLHLSLDIVFLALLISCAFLLGVIWLEWSDPRISTEKLNQLRLRRTTRYKTAWVISAASVGAVIIITIVHTFGTAKTASGSCEAACAQFYSQDVFGNLDMHSDSQ